MLLVRLAAVLLQVVLKERSNRFELRRNYDGERIRARHPLAQRRRGWCAGNGAQEVLLDVDAKGGDACRASCLFARLAPGGVKDFAVVIAYCSSVVASLNMRFGVVTAPLSRKIDSVQERGFAGMRFSSWRGVG